ncbi:MerR family transcriptional regulator [Streptomyces sp. NPDC101206]|uniref:MerR family transcriptional regulator n=1 Tax=Streptomyces sp. NPDC101206 TaxID=3366128 RepID=UPI0038234648
MDRDTLCSIGDLSRLTGLTVKAIRYYSDQDIVPPTERSPAGYRLYDVDALARLNLVRTLRDLGLDLTAVRKVLDRKASLADVAEAHADALDVEIRTLRLRRSVLRAVARRGTTPKEVDLMHRLAMLSRTERHQLMADFVDAAFAEPHAHAHTNPEFEALLRTTLPDLPDDPSPEQVEAWVELAELCQSAPFRTAVRRAAEAQAADFATGDVDGLHEGLNRILLERIDEAVAAGLLPASAAVAPHDRAMSDLYGHAFASAGDGEGDLRRWLLTRLQASPEPLAARYWNLVAAVNGWPASPTLAPVHDWFTTAFSRRSS